MSICTSVIIAATTIIIDEHILSDGERGERVTHAACLHPEALGGETVKRFLAWFFPGVFFNRFICARARAER